MSPFSTCSFEVTGVLQESEKKIKSTESPTHPSPSFPNSHILQNHREILKTKSALVHTVLLTSHRLHWDVTSRSTNVLFWSQVQSRVLHCLQLLLLQPVAVPCPSLFGNEHSVPTCARHHGWCWGNRSEDRRGLEWRDLHSQGGDR